MNKKIILHAKDGDEIHFPVAAIKDAIFQVGSDCTFIYIIGDCDRYWCCKEKPHEIDELVNAANY